MDNTTPNQPQNPQYPQYQPPTPNYGGQPPYSGQPPYGQPPAQASGRRMPQLKRWQWIAAGVGALVIVCCLCGTLVSAMNGGSSSTPTKGAASVSGPTATPQPTDTPTATPKPKSWTTIKNFSGTASTSTDTFAIPDGAHITWTCKKSDSFGGNFAVELYQSDNTLVDLVANTQDNDKGTYTLHSDGSGDGTYYLKVDTYSENWTITVQAYQ